MTDEQKPSSLDDAAQTHTEEMTQVLATEASPDASTPPPADAEAYVVSELIAARKMLKNLQMYGSIAVLVIAIYLGFIAYGFCDNLKAENAVKIVKGMATEQIEQHRDEFISEVQTRVPAMIQQAPDVVMAQMPTLRENIVQRFEDHLQGYCKQTTTKLGESLDDYLVKNKDQIKTVLDAGKDPNAVAALGAGIREEVMDYLKTQPAAGGESIDEQVHESLSMLTNCEQRLNRMANAKDLTAAEKKTRRAVAIIANTIDTSELTPVTLPQFDPDAVDTDNTPAGEAQPTGAAKPATAPKPAGAPQPAAVTKPTGAPQPTGAPHPAGAPKPAGAPLPAKK